MLKKNEVYCGDCAGVLTHIPAESVDLVITSPPMIIPEGIAANGLIFKTIAQEVTWVLKPGEVLVWIVGDATIKQSELFTSFRQALFFKEACGLLAHDTMIFQKSGMSKPRANRYRHFQIA